MKLKLITALLVFCAFLSGCAVDPTDCYGGPQ
jgi:hypothetical protein